MKQPENFHNTDRTRAVQVFGAIDLCELVFSGLDSAHDLFGRLLSALLTPEPHGDALLVGYQPPIALLELGGDEPPMLLLDVAGAPPDEVARRSEGIVAAQ